MGKPRETSHVLANVATRDVLVHGLPPGGTHRRAAGGGGMMAGGDSSVADRLVGVVSIVAEGVIASGVIQGVG